jgi:hypothetical protein
MDEVSAGAWWRRLSGNGREPPIAGMASGFQDALGEHVLDRGTVGGDAVRLSV